MFHCLQVNSFQQCCSCAIGFAGPIGVPGNDGQNGKDGLPGHNGPPGSDAVNRPIPNADDFCFTCPPGAVGPMGNVGPIGASGLPGDAGIFLNY